MTRDDNLLPEPHVRIRVTQRATPPAGGNEVGWTPFTGEVVASDAQCPVAAGDRVAGFGPPGAEIVVPPWAVTAVPPGLGTEDAALLPLAGVAARAARVVGAMAGDAACVIGSGVLAELVGDALRAAGLDEVAVASVPGPDLPLMVVETTGDPAVILKLLESAPRLARVALVGASRGRTVDVDFYRTVHQRGLEVVGVHDFGPLSEIAAGEDRARDLAAAGDLVRSMRS
jgi:hypothetical protein